MDELMPIICSLLEMSSSTMPELAGEGTEIKPDCTSKENAGELEGIINLIMKYGMNSINQLKINEIDIILILIIIVILSSNSKLNDINILKFLPVLFSIMEDC